MAFVHHTQMLTSAESIKLLGKKFYQEARGNLGYKPASRSGCGCGFKAESHQGSGCSPKQDFALIKCELEGYLPTLPKHHLVEVRKMVMQQFRKRFQRSRIPKYGSLNKGFTEQEVQRFFKVVDNEKFRLLFSYQSQLGLRIGEAVRINIKDIKFESRELVVKTEKAMTLDTLLIPAPLFLLLVSACVIFCTIPEIAIGSGLPPPRALGW